MAACSGSGTNSGIYDANDRAPIRVVREFGNGPARGRARERPGDGASQKIAVSAVWAG